MMKYLQKLGKALMLPVAVLPICGILMGIGYALAPAVMGAEGATSGAAYTVGFLLIKAGGALIDNMAWLFAIGAAVGLADNDGTAGLAGLVSFLMMQQLLNPGVVSAVRHIEEGTATYIAYQKVAGNSFIGILAAVIGAACYNKFKDTQLPDWLAFFSGKRFVAIATGLISIVVSVVLLFVWPVIFGALVGTLLESTGAALKMADCVVKLVGKKHPELAIELMGWIVSIPVFCDSGFVVLNPIRKAMARRTGASSVAMSVALSMGLYISHCFIPPTPGPIAAAGTLGCGDNLLLVMGLGALCSIPPLVAGYFFAKYIGKKVKAADDIVADGDVKTYEQLVAEFGKLPSGWLAFAPIVLPIILMGLASAFSMAGVKADFISFLGTPIIALAVGCVIAIISLFAANKGKDFYKLTDDTLKTVGPILFVTAAGGVLGKVIASSDMVSFIKANAEIFESIGIFFPFLLAAILKSAQGSSTVAITTTAGIVAPLLPVLGLDSPALSCLTVIAIGAGAMTVSHANDSYFWVVTNFGEMTPQDGYKTQTLGTLVIGVVSIIGVFIVSLFLH